MKVSAELINSLMKVIRLQEQQEAILKWSSNQMVFRQAILDNELYFATKIKKQKFKKVEFYEKKNFRTNDNSPYYNLIKEASEKIKHRDFNQLLVDDLKSNFTYDEFKVEYSDTWKKTAIDHLITAIYIYRYCYINFPNYDMKNEFSTVMMNCYLTENDNKEQGLFISEVLNSNIVFLNATIVDETKFVLFFLKLIYGQLKKNIHRINNTEKLYTDSFESFENYGENIQYYITTKVVFTISDFADDNNLSYNTAKKYLRELVENKTLKPFKISKHNAFVYVDIYNIWVK